ncbi:glycosyltransferase family 34 protein [Aspergillus affinis]|uniref:glycosyltransferase family 34 protein n=1 Tax=Aspergillus affinis TaxID=1070780 RepID=UPI0022FDCB55|nr:galactosyl transferase GMA12/MNN10 family protein [Aspergillus affinis]KAI9039216.1 galactosyl transferase GMA12/MNN10 family protein [Aspergillus affinis]
MHTYYSSSPGDFMVVQFARYAWDIHCPFLERALDTHKEHSHRQGYPLSVRRTSVLGGGWNKYAMLLSAMIQEMEKPFNQRVKWLFWFDSNTILMNPNMRLETFLPPPEFSHIHLLLTKDWNGMQNHVFFLRVHPWSIKLLSAAIAYPVTHDPVSSDLSALSNILQDNDYFARSVVYCPSRWFNAYTRTPDDEGWRAGSSPHFQIHPGDLLVNFPRTPYQHLNETMLPYLDLAEKHEKKWESTVEETGYVEEVARFWRSIHRSPSD